MIHRFSDICTESCMTGWNECLNYGKFKMCESCVQLTHGEQVQLDSLWEKYIANCEGSVAYEKTC